MDCQDTAHILIPIKEEERGSKITTTYSKNYLWCQSVGGLQNTGQPKAAFQEIRRVEKDIQTAEMYSWVKVLLVPQCLLFHPICLTISFLNSITTTFS